MFTPKQAQARLDFTALGEPAKRAILAGVFDILNGDEEWHSDTLQAIGELFDRFGVRF